MHERVKRTAALIISTMKNSGINSSQLTFTCSKSTTGTLEKGVEYVQSRSDVFIATFKLTLSK